MAFHKPTAVFFQRFNVSTSVEPTSQCPGNGHGHRVRSVRVPSRAETIFVPANVWRAVASRAAVHTNPGRRVIGAQLWRCLNESRGLCWSTMVLDIPCWKMEWHRHIRIKDQFFKIRILKLNNCSDNIFTLWSRMGSLWVWCLDLQSNSIKIHRWCCSYVSCISPMIFPSRSIVCCSYVSCISQWLSHFPNIPNQSSKTQVIFIQEPSSHGFSIASTVGFSKKNQQPAGKLKSSATRPEMIRTIHHISPSFQWRHGPFAHSSKWHLQIRGLHPMDVLWNHWTNQRKTNHPWFSSDG